ncbi:substrate-binding domain-containing protein [Paracoccus onubensis]|uniref:molybdate ABC transporter substrate-binding protein n=1 Tax=Paracoccus onubensis TaxID=1675788 RepID=UPI00272F4B9A|nr:substrate-binding domain-containing protein [Paracoccus onubensis]MDP0927649.1 substrate-binding domain-containing protein [Paracoccus onubensis]
MPGNLQIMSTLAVELAFKRDILPAWQEKGIDTSVQWSPTTVLVQEIRQGKRADAIIMIERQLEALEAEGIIEAGSITPLARARFGLGVLAGAAHPAIDTAEDFLDAIRAARSIAYSLAGASGIHFRKILQDRGMTDVLDRATPIQAGFTAEKLVSGEADLAVQQISELMLVKGVEIVGPFPEALQQTTDFACAIFADAPNAANARAFLDHLKSPQSQRAYRDGGLDSLVAAQPAA